MLGSHSPNLMHQQKPNDFMNDDMKNNNNSTNKMNNQNGNLGAGLNLESFQIFQNTMQALQVQNYNQLQKLAMPQQHQELYQLNQELLNRLKNLNAGFQSPSTPSVSAPFTPSPTQGLPNFPADSNFMFTNAAAQNFLNNNNINSNNNMIASSPLGTLNRSSSTYSTISPIGSFDQSLDNINNNNNNSSNDSAFIKPLSQVGTVTTLDNDGKVKVIVPVDHPQQQQRDRERYRLEEDFFGDRRSGMSGGGGSATLQRPPTQQRALTPILSRGDKKSQGNTVTLKVTDETGNVTNQRKLPAQPSFITRSTSEKVPNRSQMMSHVQRTQWARHTTK
jgi:carboxyl-terminal PDZ ligand of neuronal nitric oxide synthase protein